MADCTEQIARFEFYWNTLVGLKTIAPTPEELADLRIKQLCAAVWCDALRLEKFTGAQLREQVVL